MLFIPTPSKSIKKKKPDHNLPCKLQYSLFQRVEEELTLAVVYWLCWNLVFGAVRLDGVGHLGRVGGQKNPIQVFAVTLDIIRS